MDNEVLFKIGIVVYLVCGLVSLAWIKRPSGPGGKWDPRVWVNILLSISIMILWPLVWSLCFHLCRVKSTYTMGTEE